MLRGLETYINTWPATVAFSNTFPPALLLYTQVNYYVNASIPRLTTASPDECR